MDGHSRRGCNAWVKLMIRSENRPLDFALGDTRFVGLRGGGEGARLKLLGFLRERSW